MLNERLLLIDYIIEFRNFDKTLAQNIQSKLKLAHTKSYNHEKKEKNIFNNATHSL